MASERLPSRPACLLVASGAAEGVSAQSFLHCFTLASAAFNLQVATPGGKTMDFVDVNEGNARWVQDFRLKAYASPAKLESIDGARYHALLIPSCPGALADLASSGSLARILQHFRSENSRAHLCGWPWRRSSVLCHPRGPILGLPGLQHHRALCVRARQGTWFCPPAPHRGGLREGRRRQLQCQ
ncbi:glutamine amidotransferase-like class 1 domain-containing protein 1 isoform X3 [Lontra canadensis]|uniref:glutamine amidotransferase-like class 1 domain-containing protein 1 isoform X3 n=1 Tax=Lontra canadensis TaxID=76717 RepID=UPI0013F3430B|nr:glutamine amidotransferase-like class 1 domain-containing protein 1 isoform X3 [Lontra canadensis]